MEPICNQIPWAAAYSSSGVFSRRGLPEANFDFAAARPDVVRPFRATTLDKLLAFDPTVTAACEHVTGGSKSKG